MTVQAYAWATDQPLPGTAKLVLIALANHADHTNGQVHFDASTIAAEASIQVASLWRYLGALERNGYLSKDDLKSSDGDRREYWLALDRDRSLPWAWLPGEISGAQQDDVEAQASDPTDSGLSATKASKPSPAPAAFRRDRQVEARQEIKAAEPVPPAGQVPVIENTKAFRAWTEHLRERREIMPYVRAVLADGRYCRGVYMPSLFPPAEKSLDVDEMV